MLQLQNDQGSIPPLRLSRLLNAGGWDSRWLTSVHLLCGGVPSGLHFPASRGGRSLHTLHTTLGTSPPPPLLQTLRVPCCGGSVNLTCLLLMAFPVAVARWAVVVYL